MNRDTWNQQAKQIDAFLWDYTFRMSFKAGERIASDPYECTLQERLDAVAIDDKEDMLISIWCDKVKMMFQLRFPLETQIEGEQETLRFRFPGTPEDTWDLAFTRTKPLPTGSMGRIRHSDPQQVDVVLFLYHFQMMDQIRQRHPEFKESQSQQVIFFLLDTVVPSSPKPVSRQGEKGQHTKMLLPFCYHQKVQAFMEAYRVETPGDAIRLLIEQAGE